MHTGHVLRSILNDLKRRPSDAAEELAVPLAVVEDILAGAAPLGSELIAKACEVWPVNPRDFATVVDDAPNGAIVMPAKASATTRRVMDRGGRPYYEYRDTACSRVSSFRPEWIRQLQVVDDDSADHPAIEWNNGHFMHQFTYFVGPVNFYYRDAAGEKAVARMTTGDTMYICPFVPHSFAVRRTPRSSGHEDGLILALTYGSSLLGDPQHELHAVSRELARGYFVDAATPSVMVGQLIHYHMTCLSLTEQELCRRAAIEPTQLAEILDGRAAPLDHVRLGAIARAMKINLRDLLGSDEPFARVVIDKAASSPTWVREGHGYRYTFRELASTPMVPLAKSIELTIHAEPRAFAPDHRIGLHQYLYNIGMADVTLRWRHDQTVLRETIHPGDSVFLKPFVEHDYTADHGVLLSLRIQSKISGDCLRELAYIGADHVHRIVAEDRPWFHASRTP